MIAVCPRCGQKLIIFLENKVKIYGVKVYEGDINGIEFKGIMCVNCGYFVTKEEIQNVRNRVSKWTKGRNK